MKPTNSDTKETSVISLHDLHDPPLLAVVLFLTSMTVQLLVTAYSPDFKRNMRRRSKTCPSLFSREEEREDNIFLVVGLRYKQTSSLKSRVPNLHLNFNDIALDTIYTINMTNSETTMIYTRSVPQRMRHSGGLEPQHDEY